MSADNLTASIAAAGDDALGTFCRTVARVQQASGATDTHVLDLIYREIGLVFWGAYHDYLNGRDA